MQKYTLRLAQLSVLHDGGVNDWSAADGQWENDGVWSPVLAIRWNGRSEEDVGTPQSRGHATWYIVPDELEKAVREVIEGLRRTKPDGV